MTQRPFLARLVGGPEGFRRFLESRGPIFVRLGQLLALRPDIVPQAYSDELFDLAGHIAPTPWDEISRRLTQELGDPTVLFESINPIPVTVRPLAQVHLAVTKSGQSVRLKILRPRIHERLEKDRRRIRLLSRLIPWNTAETGMSPVRLAEELTSLLERELDLANERANIERLTELARRDPSIRVPRVYPELSTAGVLTTERSGEIALADILSPARRMDLWPEGSEVDTDELARNLMQSTFRQIFEYRFYNPDLHAHNLLLAPGNTMAYADSGLCEKVDPNISREVAHYIGGIHRPDLQEMFRLLLALAVPSEGADAEQLKDEFMAEGHQWLGNIPPAAAGRRSGGNRPPTVRWIVGVMQALRRNHFQLPGEIQALFRALVSAETLAYRLAPAVHLRSPVAREYFASLHLDEAFRLLEPGVQQNLSLKLLTALHDAPENLNRILQELAEGRLAVTLNVTEPSGAARARDRRSRLIVAAVISVAIAWMIGQGGLPAIGSVPVSGILGVALGLLYLYIFVHWKRL